MRERFSIFVVSISAEMGVMLWGKKGEGVEELDGICRVMVFRTEPLLEKQAEITGQSRTAFNSDIRTDF